MLKKLKWLALALLPLNIYADPSNDGGMSDECLRSMRDLYKFYYYEIQPNPKVESAKDKEGLGSTETLKMQIVIAELRKNCNHNMIARVNESLRADLPESQIATG